MVMGPKRAKRNDPGVVRRDHARRRYRPSPSDAAVTARLEEVVLPALEGLGGAYRQLGLRQRVLTLPVLAAAVLAMIWQQVPSLAELVRLLVREPLLWLPEALRVSEQGVNQRLRCLPATLFEQVVTAVLPELAALCAPVGGGRLDAGGTVPQGGGTAGTGRAALGGQAVGHAGSGHHAACPALDRERSPAEREGGVP